MPEKYTPSKDDYIKVQGNKQYLPVPARVQWFRGEHPDWTISTSVVELAWEIGYAVMRAEVIDDTGRLIASGMKTETRKGFSDFVEKAETGAVGRALARAGYGTEDALDLEGDRYADAPIQQPGQAPVAEAQPAPAQPTDEQLRHRYQWARQEGWPDDEAVDASAIESTGQAVMAMDNDTWRVFAAAVLRGGPRIEPAAGTVGQPEAASVPDAAPADPPRPGTDAYKALSVTDKANARAFWAHWDAEERRPPVNPEQEALEMAL